MHLQDVDLRRHLLRLWVAPSEEDGAYPLAPAFAELYHSTEPGNRGGIYIEGYTETIPLEAELGNKLASQPDFAEAMEMLQGELDDED